MRKRASERRSTDVHVNSDVIMTSPSSMLKQAETPRKATTRQPGRCNMKGQCGKKSVFSPELPCALDEEPAQEVSHLRQPFSVRKTIGSQLRSPHLR